ncbi:MAG: PAS domain S-box protein [Opitutales bacterium]|nr:PAS domain S-box protein [Opitutales bacterium]
MSRLTPIKKRAWTNLPEISAVVVFALGMVVLVAWAVDFPLLKSLLPGEETMKANTAVAFIFLGAALFLVVRGKGESSGWPQVFGGLFSGLAGCLGFATLIQYVFGVNLGIDEGLFQDREALSPFPGRMAPQTALAVIATALCIFLVGRTEKRKAFAAVALFLALFLILVAVLAGLGYGANLTVGYRWGPVTVMAVHTAIGFFFLGVGILSLLESRGQLRWHLPPVQTGALLGGVLLLILVALIGWETMLRWRATNLHLVQTLENRHRLSSLSAHLFDLERNQRGFRLHGEPGQEASVRLARQAVDEDLRYLRQSLIVPGGAGLVDRLSQNVEEKIALNFALMERPDIPTGAADHVRVAASGYLAVEIAALLSALDEQIRVSGERAAENMRAQERRAVVVLPAGTLVSLVLIGLALALFNAEAGIRQAGERRFRGIFDTAFQFIGLLRPDGTVEEANETALHFVGCRMEDIYGRYFLDTPWLRGQSLEQRERLEAAFRRAVEGESLRFEIRIAGLEGARSFADYSLKPLRSPSGEVLFVIAEAHDITALKMAQEKLVESEQRWDAALSGSELGVWDWNPITQKCYYSPHYCSMLGYKPGDFGDSGEDWSRRVHPDDYRSALAAIRDHLEGHTPTYSAEFRIRARDGQWKWILDRGRVMQRDAAGRAIRMVGTHTDITPQREALERVRVLQGQLQGVLKFSPDIISLIDCEGRYLLVGHRAAEIIGLPRGEIEGRLFEEVLDPSVATVFRARIERMQQHPQPWNVEDLIPVAGDERTVETQLFPLFDPGGELFAVGGIARDVTDQRAMMAALQSTLEEREVLLREIHHRVKNNLQVISSLLNIQARHLPEGRLREPFEECRRRVASMSLIHDQLYRRRDIGRIDFGSYLEELIRLQRTAFGLSGERLEVSVRVDVPPLEIGLAVSCGLIVNELLSNACKHAFPVGRSGRIQISLDRTETEQVWTLSVEDDGIGHDSKVGSGDGLGLELVTALTRQLNGALAIETTGGCRVAIRFPAPVAISDSLS